MYTILVIGNCPLLLKKALQNKVNSFEKIQAIQFPEDGQERFHTARRGLYDGNIFLIFPEEGVPGVATESAGLQKIPVIVCNMDGKLDHWLNYLKFEDTKLKEYFNINCFNPKDNSLNVVLPLDSNENVDIIAEKIFLVLENTIHKYPTPITRSDDTTPSDTEIQALMNSLTTQNKNMLFTTLQKRKPTASVICAAHPLKTIAFNFYELGKVIGKTGFDFINGAGGKRVGKLDEDQPLMYQTAYGAKTAGARNTGVITPFECIKYEKNNDLSIYDSMIFVDNLSERIKAFSSADVVIVGPGGTGTMDEFWALNSNQIIVLNIDGFYNNLKQFLINVASTKSVTFVSSIQQLEEVLFKLHSELKSQYQGASSEKSVTLEGLFNKKSNQMTTSIQVERDLKNTMRY